jgi:hypothetical protein
MNFPDLNETQNFIIQTIKERMGSDVTEKWLFIRNKHFNNKAPIDYILSENYNYFDHILNNYS